MTVKELKSVLFKNGSEKSKKYLIVTALLGFVLVFISSLTSASETENDKSEMQYSEKLSQYCIVQENRLEKILSSIEGVGNARVMLTLENGVEYRYAADEKQSGDSIFTYAEGGSSPSKVQQSENTEQNYIMIGSSGDKKPLVVTELSPKVKGVVVVCDGGADPIVIKRVNDAVTTALGINSLQVCVAKASK